MFIKFKKVLGTREIFIILLLSVLITSVLVFVFGHKPIITEIQIIAGIISIILFVFLFIGLYCGFRLKKEKVKIKFDYKPIDIVNCDGFGSDFTSGADDLVSGIIAILLWVLVSILIFVFISFVFPFIWGMLVLMGLIIYWIFYRAMRIVFIKARKCRGNAINSLGFSLLYSILYSGWLLIIISIVKILKKL